MSDKRDRIEERMLQDAPLPTDIDYDAVREEWCGHEFDYAEFELDGGRMAAFAAACGETERRYTDPEHPDFRAVPNYTTSFHGSRAVPKAFPIRMMQSFDGGKTVESFAPIRPGDQLIGRSLIHDIYTKSGRSGKMLFIVHRMRFTNQDDELVSVVDWKLLQKLG